MKFTFSFFLLMGLILSSCADLEKSGQLDRISGMMQTVDSIETIFNEHKLDTMNRISLNAYGVENRIKQFYKSDTINMELGRKMDAFKLMRKSLAPIGKAMSNIPVSIGEERAKLDNLRSDIENSNGKREKYEEYLVFEEQKVQQLRTLLKEFVEMKKMVVKTYSDLYGELNAFSMSLLPK